MRPTFRRQGGLHTAVSGPKVIPEDPLTTWYRQLASLHHDNPVLRSGSVTFLDFDAQNALVWVSKPAPNAPRLTAPVVVICNLSSTPLQLSLEDAMKHLNLHGFFLPHASANRSRHGSAGP